MRLKALLLGSTGTFLGIISVSPANSGGRRLVTFFVVIMRVNEGEELVVKCGGDLGECCPTYSRENPEVKNPCGKKSLWKIQLWV